jgi:hypothetical protein
MAIERPLRRSPKFQELFDDAVSLIPRLAPAWTNHNLSDPGIALVETLAYLTDLAVYRAGRVNSGHERDLLRQLGLTPGPGTVAQTIFSLVPTLGHIPTELAGDTLIASAAGLEFRTTTAVTYQPILPVALTCGPAGGTRTVLPLGVPLQPLGRCPTLGNSFLLELSCTGPIDGPVSIYIWTGALDHDQSTVRSLRALAQFVDTDAALVHHSVRLLWEIEVASDIWRPLSGLQDETRALTVSGFVRFVEPAGLPAGSPGAPVLRRLRVRVARGQYEQGPTIARLVGNAVLARAIGGARVEHFASGGTPEEAVSLSRRPVLVESCQVTVTRPGPNQSGEPWEVSRLLDGQDPSRRTVILDEETGTLTFPDGPRGEQPPTGSAIEVRYRPGGGPDGNVPSKTMTDAVAGTGALAVPVDQPFAAHGGAWAETLIGTKRRALDLMAQPRRLCTSEDLRLAALSVPGVTIARAWVLDEMHPDAPGVPTPGATTILMIPPEPATRPVPSVDTIREVERQLRSRTVWGMAVYVDGPRFVTVTVGANLVLTAGASVPGVQTAALTVLGQYFDPFVGGPESKGWPLGRSVYRSEILSLLAGLTNVRGVASLSISVGDSAPNTCSAFCLGATALPLSGTHQITASTQDPSS